MKIFLDRISDCLKTEKKTGRKLRGMKMAVLSCGFDKDLKQGFQMPFIESANYLGMKYVGDVHSWVENDVIATEAKQNLNKFIQIIS